MLLICQLVHELAVSESASLEWLESFQRLFLFEMHIEKGGYICPLRYLHS